MFHTSKTAKAMKCDQCEMLSINGVACHETGCPNIGKVYDHDEERWVATHECDICGYEVREDDICCEDY